MGLLVSYTLQAAVAMMLLYLGYKWLMASSTFHTLNRFSLIAIIALSWILPLLVPLLTHKESMMDIEPLPVIPATEIIEPLPYSPSQITWPLIVAVIYIVGLIVTLIISIAGMIRMAKIIRSGRCYTASHLKLIVTPLAPCPFSWLRWIIIRPEDCDDDLHIVLTHEHSHLSRLHWIDLALAQINVILQWFNPAAWLIIQNMKSVHEYQADAATKKTTDFYSYQILLLKKTVGSSFPTFADSLNHSQIKQRLTMMMKSESRATRRMATLAIPALAATAIFTLANPSVANVIEEIESVSLPDFSDSKVTNSPANAQRLTEPVATSMISVDETDELIPTEIDNNREEDNTIDSGAMLPQESNAEENINNKDNKSKTLSVFVNDKEYLGKLSDIGSSDIKSISIVKNDPAYPNGKIMVTLYKPGEKPENDRQPEIHPAAAVEKIADFKGGQKALMDFLAQNLKMPTGVKLDKKERVIVQFTVQPDGSVTSPKLMKRGSDPKLDEEAMRVVKMMSGHWEPATNGNNPVASNFTIPILFSPE